MEQRKQFITEYLCGTDSFKALCQKFGISEKTGHKWKNRFLEFGFSGLADQSKAPSNSPNQLDEDTVIRLIKMRSAHPAWGPRNWPFFTRALIQSRQHHLRVVFIAFWEKLG